jgi:hypothetical protein
MQREPSRRIIAAATAWLAAQPDSPERTQSERPDQLSADQRERLNFPSECDPIGTRR